MHEMIGNVRQLMLIPIWCLSIWAAYKVWLSDKRSSSQSDVKSPISFGIHSLEYCIGIQFICTNMVDSSEFNYIKPEDYYTGACVASEVVQSSVAILF